MLEAADRAPNVERRASRFERRNSKRTPEESEGVASTGTRSEPNSRQASRSRVDALDLTCSFLSTAPPDRSAPLATRAGQRDGQWLWLERRPRLAAIASRLAQQPTGPTLETAQRLSCARTQRPARDERDALISDVSTQPVNRLRACFARHRFHLRVWGSL